MQNPPVRPSLVETVRTEVPRILLLIGLLLILLVILTRFRWIHCSQVLKVGPINMPTNWCEVYCTYLHGQSSRIAIVYGDDGIGDPQLLARRIQQQRPQTMPAMLRIDQFAVESITGYDLVIFERAKRMTPAQAQAARSFIARGGTMLWIGDSGTDYYYQDIDIQNALQLNRTYPFFYEQFEKELDTIKASGGFGPLTSALGVKYNATQEPAAEVALESVAKDNLLLSGIVDEMTFKKETPFAMTVFNPVGASMVSQLKLGSGAYPAIVEVRNPRLSVIYVSFPLELSPSDALIGNLLDYMVLC